MAQFAFHDCIFNPNLTQETLFTKKMKIIFKMKNFLNEKETTLNADRRELFCFFNGKECGRHPI